jgi:hypothetical protein
MYLAYFALSQRNKDLSTALRLFLPKWGFIHACPMRMKLTRISHWGAAPNPFVFWFFCGEAAKKPKHKHFSGVCNPQSPALQSGTLLSLMRMGFIHA